MRYHLRGYDVLGVLHFELVQLFDDEYLGSVGHLVGRYAGAPCPGTLSGFLDEMNLAVHHFWLMAREEEGHPPVSGG
jgi:hypothetical protein